MRKAFAEPAAKVAYMRKAVAEPAAGWGYVPPLMSPALEPAAPGLLLYFALARTPILLLRKRLQRTLVLKAGSPARHFGSGDWGVLRSEVKEEDRAQPGPGDTNGAVHPKRLILNRCSRAMPPKHQTQSKRRFTIDHKSKRDRT